MKHKPQLLHNEVIKHLRVFPQSVTEILRRHEGIVWLLLYLLLIGIYSFYIWDTYIDIIATTSHHFGYLDTQENWTALDHFVQGHRFFQDYFYQYGWFLLLLQSIPYLLFQESYLAELISRFIFLPVFGVLLSILTAWNIFKKKYLIWIFLFFAFVLTATTKHTVVRHQVAELALSFFVLFLFSGSVRYAFIAGIVGGLAILTSLEYGLALTIGIGILFLLHIICKLQINRKSFLYFFIGEAIIIVPYMLFVVGIEGMKNFIAFTGGFITNYYYASPCSGYSFPRFSDIETIIPSSKLLVAGIPIEFLQHLNLYVVFIYYMILGLLLLYKYKRAHKLTKRDIVQLAILLYAGLAFVRTLDNPCIGFFAKGAVPTALLLTFTVDDIYRFIKKSGSTRLRRGGIIALVLIFGWFTLTQLTNYPTRILASKPPVEKVATPSQEYFSWAGMEIDSKYVNDYNQINEKILQQTTLDDYVFVYPWGPYNIMTGRKVPNSVIDSTQYAAGEQFITRTVKELEQKKPKLIVVSTTKNLSIAAYTEDAITHTRYLSVKEGTGLYFPGKGDNVQRYILEKYEPTYVNDVAVIMKPREDPITLRQHFKKITSIEDFEKHSLELKGMKKIWGTNTYWVTGNKSSWAIGFDQPTEATDINITFKVDGDFLTKRLVRYWPKVEVELADGSSYPSATQEVIATKDWQTVQIILPEKKPIKRITMTMSDNKGLIWWMNPYLLQVQNVIFYEWKK